MTDPSAPGPPGDPRRSPWDPPAGPLPSAPPVFPPSGPPAAPSPAPTVPPPPVPSGEGEAPPWGSWTPPPATPGGPFPSAGASAGASAGGSEPLRGVKGPRYGSPRFSGRGILAVFGLLGVLVTLGIMVLLVVRVLDGVGGSSAGDTSDLDGLVTTAPAPSGPPSTVSGPAGASPAGPIGAAEAGACAADRETVSTAVEAYHVMNGSYPPDVQSLLDAGLVSFDGPVDMELHINGDTVVVVGTGPCAGR
ncbi:MAG TPA: hypothetical protein PKE05_13465 [Microthrixaceae bacterium]|nr:hypothetical protein [Microthrixaceae bacterium]